MIICFIILRNKNCVNKIISRNSTLYKFLIKTYLEPLVFGYYFIIYLESFIKVFFLTWTSYWTTSSSVNPSISGATLRENAPWVPGIFGCSLIHCFSFFSIIATFEVTSCISLLKCLWCSNSLVPLPFLLCHYVHNKIKWKLWHNKEPP